MIDFQSDAPLQPNAAAMLHTFFEQGWADPAKLHHQSSSLRILLAEAKEEIAGHLGRKVDELEFVGELGFGFWSAISGLLEDSRARRENVTFIHSAIDRQVVHAFARRLSNEGGSVQQMSVNQNGEFDVPQGDPSAHRAICWQGTNRESGTIQRTPTLNSNDSLFADMTASMPQQKLPDGWSVALWDPQKFAGPQGIAILAISKEGRWRSPIPPMDKRRVFGSYSKPLLLASAVALSSFVADYKDQESHLRQLHQELRGLLRAAIPDLRLLDEGVDFDPRYCPIGIPSVIGEEIVRAMEERGFLIDAGSACGAGPLSPSHVFDAMGWTNVAHIRISLDPNKTSRDIQALSQALIECVSRGRE